MSYKLLQCRQSRHARHAAGQLREPADQRRRPAGPGLRCHLPRQPGNPVCQPQLLPHRPRAGLEPRFLECVKTRQRPASDIETCYKTTAICLLANVSLRTKLRLDWDHANQTTAQKEARKYVTREYRKPWKLVVSRGLSRQHLGTAADSLAGLQPDLGRQSIQ